ncbi:hypothetical protein [Brevundimonas sp.]|uniref:hypothetical protein n=1 Tax=Brevundimonas sp. TaxID=1871086 RepID=UPI003D0E84B9
MSRFIILPIVLLISGCSAGVYTEEVTSLATAGRVLAAAPATYQTARYELDVQDYQLGLIDGALSGEFPTDDPDCATDIEEADAAYRAAADAPGSTAAQITAAFERLRDVAACGLGPSAPPLSGAYVVPAQEALLVKRLGEYLTGLEAIVGGKTVTEIAAALAEAKAASSGLATAADAPGVVGVASDLAFDLFAATLEHKRYAALREAVIAFDPAWREAAPDITAFLRTHHRSLLSDRLSSARITRATMAAALARSVINDCDEAAGRAGFSNEQSTSLRASCNAATEDSRRALVESVGEVPRGFAEPATLAAYDRLNPFFTARSAEVRTTLAVDPATTVAAFTAAHGKLVEALNDPDRQTAGVFQAIADLVTSARALEQAIEGDDE